MPAINTEVEYDNRARVPEHPEIFARWQRAAAAFRAAARDTSPETVCSIESGVELRHEDWVRRIERFLERFPPERGRRNVLAIADPHELARAVLYAGWADGFTTVALGSEDLDGGSACRRFANLAELEGLEGMSDG